MPMTLADVHYELLKNENRSYHNALAERVVYQGEVIDRLTEMVAENTRQIAELHRKVDALMDHLGVPYKCSDSRSQ